MGEEKIVLKVKYVIDVVGCKFLFGKKIDNLLFGVENLFGVDNGLVWLRVKNIDCIIFYSGYYFEGFFNSYYYVINYFFGYGYWLWMIFIEK